LFITKHTDNTDIIVLGRTLLSINAEIPSQHWRQTPTDFDKNTSIRESTRQKKKFLSSTADPLFSIVSIVATKQRLHDRSIQTITFYSRLEGSKEAIEGN
jgi:hypothetical protein